LKVEVREGKDPQADKAAQRGAGTFKELADRYVAYAKKCNKSWRQARALVERFLIPPWGKLLAAEIRRGDVKHMMASIEAPIVANQTLAATSAIFTWAIREEFGGLTENPCKLVQRNETRSRERVLSESELPPFWAEFEKAGVAGAALKLILLTGQRPGEISCMRREHIEDGWWTMPGELDPKLRWARRIGCGCRSRHRRSSLACSPTPPGLCCPARAAARSAG